MSIEPQGAGASEFDISHYRRRGTANDIYYTSSLTGYGTSTIAAVSNTLYTNYFIVSNSVALDSIAIHVSTSGAGNARLGIYDGSGTNLYPENLIVDAGTVDISTTGVKALTINESLSKGLYWLCMVSNVNFTPKALLEPVTVMGHLSTSFPSCIVSWSVAFAYAALPATFPGGGTEQTTNQPLIAVRISS